MKVFVYGSLKQGRGNHRVLELSNAAFLGKSETLDDVYIMLDFGCYPGVVEIKENETTIKGEVYEVESLNRLDYLEGYPHLYDRKEVKLKGGNTAWMYLFNKFDMDRDYQLVNGGEW